jgi:centromere protein C
MARSPHKSSSPDNVEVGTEVNRRLDFLEQEESNVQETPVLSGSGPRRGAARRDIYDLEESPVPGNSMQEEDDAAANDEYDESAMLQLVQEDSFAGAVEANEVTEADAEEGSIQEDETVEEVVKQPAKRGRKRKSDALEPVAERESPRTSTRATRRQSAEKPGKQAAPSGKKPRGRPPLNKQATPPAEEEPSLATNATEEAEEEAGQPPKKRGRGRGARNQTEQDEAAEERAQSAEPEANKGRKRSKPGPNPGAKKPAADQSAFKKPGPKSKSKAPEKASDVPDLPPGRLVDTLGKPIDDVDRRSITTAGSRFSRARSIFCERKAEELGAVSRTGRRNIKPVDFWRNERAAYDKFGNLLVVRQNESVEPPPQKKAKKGRKKKAAPDEDDEGEELEDWEANEGVLVGTYRDYDPATETASDELLEAGMSGHIPSHSPPSVCAFARLLILIVVAVIAWAPKGIVPAPVPNAQFKFTKLGSAGGRPFFSWGCIDLDEDDIKRSKNSRRMQMVFSITEGAAEVAVAENVFTVHKGGVWQVPRGEFELAFVELWVGLMW